MLKSKPVCYKTIAMLGSVFLIGLMMGSVAVYEFFWSPAPVTARAAIVPDNSVPEAIDLGPTPEREFQVNSGAIRALALSKDGMLLATGSEGGVVQIWDVTAGKVISELRPTNDQNAHAHTATVWAIEFADNDQTLITASDDNQVKVWDMQMDQLSDDLDVPLGRLGPFGGGHAKRQDGGRRRSIRRCRLSRLGQWRHTAR